MPTVKVRDLGKVYHAPYGEITAVAGVSVEIAPGKAVLIRGPSGSGKSTLLNMIGLLTRPSAGTVLMDGREVSHLPDHFMSGVRRNTIGFIFQQFNLLAGYSAVDNVAMPLVPAGIREAERRKRAASLLGELGLGDRADFPVNHLSAGEQQRVAICRALINDPPLILADEPDANLDDESAATVVEVLAGLKRAGRTLLIASHSPRWMRSDLIDETLEMRGGQLLSSEGRA
jgi:putative ABC transport system ATP-binding protein